jgi:hypothetical protein
MRKSISLIGAAFFGIVIALGGCSNHSKDEHTHLVTEKKLTPEHDEFIWIKPNPRASSYQTKIHYQDKYDVTVQLENGC